MESDPVAMRYIKSLGTPGAIDRVFLDLPELIGKQFGLLKEMVPGLSHIAIFGIAASTRRNSQRAAVGGTDGRGRS